MEFPDEIVHKLLIDGDGEREEVRAIEDQKTEAAGARAPLGLWHANGMERLLVVVVSLAVSFGIGRVPSGRSISGCHPSCSSGAAQCQVVGVHARMTWRIVWPLCNKLIYRGLWASRLSQVGSAIRLLTYSSYSGVIWVFPTVPAQHV